MIVMDVSTPLREPTVRVGPLVNLAALLQSRGHDPLPVFSEFELDPASYQDPDQRVPYLRSSRLLARCVEVTGCEHLGLLLGQMAEPSHLGLPGFLVHAAPTVEQALTALVDHLDLHDEGGTAALDIGKTFSSFSYSVHLEEVSALEQINDLSGVMIYKIMALLCGPEWIAQSVRLQRKEPADRTPWRRFFRTAIYYDATECEVTFNNQCLERQPPTADALLFRHLEQEANSLHELKHAEITRVLPAVMRRCLLNGSFAAKDVAEALGLHERTLHRRLRNSRTSFRQELDLARQSVSEQLLQFTNLAVSEIATTLGYADASGFIRAFKRWCGTSPNAWRKQNVNL